MDRPQHHEISPLLFGRQRALDGMHGGSQQLRGLEQASHHRNRQTTLSQVHSVSRQGKGQIDTVIDEELRLPQFSLQLACDYTEVTNGEVSFTQLHGAHTCRDRLPEHRQQRPPGGLMTISNEIQAEIDGRHQGNVGRPE
ncbi:hypothetical protein NSPZN2_80162 [Nitrospira defluvii]|uniref:Uncharacterized protein n=1 Tax=Nitrospira defluvii TaxID=330214 RepID=A0ABM8SDL8_9BACT|nr:hypothetical protein NSPZN2_80162 [Nitrospira defluvii]